MWRTQVRAAKCVPILLLLRLDSIGRGREFGRLRKREWVGSFDVRASGNRRGTEGERRVLCDLRGGEQ